MSREELVKAIAQFAQRIVDAPDEFPPGQRNEEWTKNVFILPFLEALGWDRYHDVSYEYGSQEGDERLDYVLLSQPAIGIEAKALDVKPPEDRSHPQIAKGLRQSQERGAAYFIWTNGDCWQFFSLALPDAPMYDVRLTDAHNNPAQAEQIADDVHLIDKALFSADPNVFDEAILEKWKAAALPAVLHELLNQRQHEFLQLVRQSLPDQLHIEDEEILSFFAALKLPAAPAEHVKERTRRTKKSHSFPEDWHELLHSFEPEPHRARTRFREGYYRKLGQYLISGQYRPWSKSTTWRHVGAPDVTNERKKLGPVISLFREWHFIEEAETVDVYQRVEESVLYLQKLLE